MIQGLSAVPLPGSDTNAENTNWSGPCPPYWRESFLRLTLDTGQMAGHGQKITGP